MQYRALFKKKDDITFDEKPASVSFLAQESKPQAKPIRTADNKVDQRYLTNKLLEIEKKQNQNIKRPALLIQSTDELLKQLPKGETLLEEAEIAVSKILKKNENPENLLRETVENLHLKQLQRIESGYIENYNDLLKQIEETEQKNIELEQKIRKYSMQANTEDEEIEEIRKNTEKIKDLEAVKEESYREKVLMEETISLLQKDINETIARYSNEKENLDKEILIYKEKVTQLNNQKVGNL